MAKYELTADLLTGHKLIDDEHKELFRAINDLMEACSSGKGRAHLESTFNFLEGYIAKHFQNEEKLQQSVNYPELTPHRLLHEQFKNKTRSIGMILRKDGASMSALSELNMFIATLVNHVRREDKKIADFIKNK